MPGGSLVSKPMRRNSNRCSVASAFLLIQTWIGIPMTDEFVTGVQSHPGMDTIQKRRNWCFGQSAQSIPLQA